MVSHTLILTKVIGTVTLGALAGSIVSTTQIAIPLLLVPKTTEDLKSALTTLRLRSLSLISPLAITSFSALTISYLFAPAAGRHPYLVYSALSVPVVAAISYLKALPVFETLFATATAAVSPALLPVVESGSTGGQSTPVTQQSSPALSATLDEEHSGLDNSVYRNISKSDYEEDSESENSERKVPEQTIHETIPVVSEPVAAATAPATAATTVSVSAEVPALVERLSKLGNIAGAVSGFAFVLATVGIYGDATK